MADLADELGISENLSGVTFLALGNGAPDLSSSIDALTNSQAAMGLSALLGCACFVPTIVIGVVALICPDTSVDKHLFLRDVGFLFFSIAYVLYIALREEITLIEAVSLWVIYALYVITVFFGEFYSTFAVKRVERLESHMSNISKISSASSSIFLHRLRIFDNRRDYTSTTDRGGGTLDVPLSTNPRIKITGPETNRDDLLGYLGGGYDVKRIPVPSTQRKGSHEVDVMVPYPMNVSPEPSVLDEIIEETSLLDRLYYILVSPTLVIELACWLTIPLLQPGTWTPHMGPIYPIVAPLFVLWAGGFWETTIYNCRLIYVSLVISMFFAMVIFFQLLFTDFRWRPSAWYSRLYYLALGFLTSICWIFLIADELVNLLSTIGLLTGVKQDILGISVLAWGNSVGDMMSNISVAKAGRPNMAIAASIGAPLLNILIGTGISMTIKAAKAPTHAISFPISETIFLSSIFALMGLLMHSVVSYLHDWKLSKASAYIGFFIYGIFFSFCLYIMVSNKIESS